MPVISYQTNDGEIMQDTSTSGLARDTTPIMTAIDNTLLTSDTSGGYGVLPSSQTSTTTVTEPTGTSAINPNPIDVVPTATTESMYPRPVYTTESTNTSVVESNPTPTGTSAINPSPIDVVSTNTATTDSSVVSTGASTIDPSPVDIVPAKTEPTGSVTISGVPLLGTGITGILGSLGNVFGGAGASNQEQPQELKEKENKTYWLYVIGGALVLGYILTSKKSK